MEEFSFYVVWAALAGFMLVYYLRRQHRVRSMLWGTLTGLAGLILLHYSGRFTGFSPEFSLFNIMQSCLLGIPGVILMSVCHFVL